MPGGVIAAVAPGGLAERVGLRPGDVLLAINGREPRDIVDVRFYAADDRLALRVWRAGEAFTVEAERQYGEPIGLEFTQPVFDGMRRCENGCEFCFVTQMPRGLRRSLYVKDDDYRYSFLFGNYITLTNLDVEDWARIEQQNLSPLYVSVHTTEFDLRRQVLRNPTAPDVLAQLSRLADLGIEVHTQIVVVPGLNDGPHLDRSIGDLSGLYPAVCSASVVPVGVTRFHRGGCRAHDEAEVRAVFEQVSAWQTRLREQLGVGFVYLSDEWYLRLGEEVPSSEAYDGLDLTENGVGLVRRFLETVDSRLTPHASHTLVTGVLFAPVLRAVTSAEVVPVANHFFGETVTVAGLLTGQDVMAQLQGRDLREVVVLPPAMFGGPEGQSLDGMWPHEVGEALGCEVIVEAAAG